MPAQRIRYSELGRPMPCKVVLPPDIAEVLYQERLDGRYRDETELVCEIVRTWAKGKTVDRRKLLKRLREELEAEEQDDGGGATKAG